MSARLEPVAGVYPRGSLDYAAVDAVNWSTLKHLARSPRHYRHVVDEGVLETPPMRLGTAAHLATLEPDRFEREYVFFPDDPDGKAPRRGTKAWDAFVAEHEGCTVLKQVEHVAAARIAEAVHTDELARRYLERGQAEVGIVWQDQRTGLWCKGRLDWLSHSIPDVVVELKSAADVAPAKFQAGYARMLYHGQAAFYTDGLTQLLGRPVYHKCIAVESKEPHDVVVYDVIGEPLEAGTELYRELLDQLVRCQRDGAWPGHGKGAEVSLRLPPWAMGHDDDLSDLGLTFEET